MPSLSAARWLLFASAAALCVACVLAWGPPGQAGGKFKPGWNKKALTPPLGWRSWNAYGNKINQDIIKENIDALVAKNWTVDGAKVSLFDIGYTAAGIDEGWEGCGQGVNGTQHYVNGTPVIDTSRFPDMAGLVSYGHSKGLTMGWYENGCACGEKVEKLINYEGDIRSLHDLGFDAVKLDGCGHQRNLTLYAELMAATGKDYAIENCHWGDCNNADDSSCPSLDWCPFNWYRTSGDINASPSSWFNNLQTTIKFQDRNAPLSRPGCWAYPDMLEVGRVQGSYEWNRAHFGAWCVVSAPLVLGLELTESQLTPVIDVITNKEAIAINQAWYGHPGTLVATFQGNASSQLYVAGVPCATSDPTQHGWVYDTGSRQLKHDGDRCVDGSDASQVTLQPCDKSSANQRFFLDGNHQLHFQAATGTKCLDVWDWDGPRVDIYPCNGGTNQQFQVSADGTVATMSGGASEPSRCLASTSIDPSGGATTDVVQMWAKPLEGDSWAVLFINPLTNKQGPFTVDFASILHVKATSFKLRDVWAHQDLGHVASAAYSVTIGPTDSVFLVITPEA